MGLLDDLSKLSKTTAKNALNGDLVWKAWDRLIEEACRALQLELTAQHLEHLRQECRKFDGHFSRLDDLGLPPEDLLPPVLRLLIPQLGVRLGALAVMVDDGLWSTVKAACPALADWLCEPLSPRVFGRLVEALLRLHQPDWKTLSQQKAELASRRIASKRAVERWRSKSDLAVPNISNIEAIATLMGGPQEQQNALLLLRLGRLLSAARKALSRWIGASEADGVEAAVRAWARMTRTMLTKPESLAGFGELMGQALAENPDAAAAFVMNRKKHWAPLLDAIEAKDIGEALIQASQELREGGEGALLRGLLYEQVLTPNPLLITAVGHNLGAENVLVATTTDPVQILQWHWRVVFEISKVADGEPFPWPESLDLKVVKHHEPSAEQVAHAQQLREQLRLVVRRDGDGPPSQIDLLRFWMELAHAAGGMEAIEQVTKAWNATVPIVRAPLSFEPLVGDDVVEQNPHFASLRAHRLAESGDFKAAIRWLGMWKNNSTSKSSVERSAAATTMLTIAHGCLDRVSGQTRFLNLGDEQSSAVNNAVALISENIEQAVELACQLLDDACLILPDSEMPDRLPELLVLAIRVDIVDAALEGDSEIELHCATPIAEELDTLLKAHATHPRLWAGQAIWQELIGVDATFSLKHAQHYGADSAYDEMRARLVTDGVFDPR